MKEPKSFPHEYQESGLIFRIYSAAVVKSNKDGTETTHSSFIIKYYQAGQLVQKRQKSWEAVESHIEEVVAAVRQNDPERLELTGRDRRSYLAAVEALKPVGGEVDQAVRDYVAACQVLAPHNLGLLQAVQQFSEVLKRLGNTPITTAVEFYHRHGQSMTATKTVPNIITELLADLRRDRRGKYHLRDMETRLGRFAQSFPGVIHEIVERDITAWLQEIKKVVWRNGEQVENEAGDLVSERTRNNYRDAVRELFEFAKKRGYLSKDLPTEASATTRVEVVAGKNHIISPEHAKAGLQSLSPELIPYTVLKLFSGLRTEEAFGLSWEELRFQSKAVIIEARLAKLRQRRVPPISSNLANWLKPFQGLKGRIVRGYSRPQAIHNAVARDFRKAGVELGRNTFRNCYISYRVAQPTAPAVVAAETGTSVRMIESNYKELATKDEAKGWFSVNPSKKQLEKLRKYTKSLKSDKK